MSRTLFVVAATVVVASIPMRAQAPTATGPRGAVPRATVARATPPRIDAVRVLPGTRADVFTTIQGNALSSSNGSLANAFVRLRDARIGHIVGSQLTDQLGLFAFRSIDPGSYIIEIVDTNQSAVLAASQVLNAGPGEAISAVVKLPFRMPPFAGVLGTRPASLGAVTTQASSAGVLATQAAGSPTCEQVR
jgi:hypothetical protein